jgi:hypothetical protein
MLWFLYTHQFWTFPKLCSWFYIYLANRHASVPISGTISSYTFKYGVPQGSILRRLLFNTCINDIYASIQYSNYEYLL